MTGSAYWRSLDELADTPRFRAFVEHEFPNFAPELLEGPTRRRFLKLMGASLALAGMAGCRWPKEQILPYANRPDNRMPGVPVNYATAMEVGGVSQGLLVESYDQRPIKIEGNDLHPNNRGKSDAFAQAALLSLYDPERCRAVRRAEPDTPAPVTSDWGAALSWLQAQGASGKRLAVLSEYTSSPTIARLKDQLAQRTQLTWVSYEPLNRDAEIEAARRVFGKPLRMHVDYTQADVIVSLDDDFLMRRPASLRYTRDFVDRRKPEAASDFDMNRLYVFEPSLSVTGGRADIRRPVRPTQVARLAKALHDAVTGAPADVEATGVTAALFAELVQDLESHRGRCVVTAGANQPAAVHEFCQQLNVALGAVGRTLLFTEEPLADQQDSVAALQSLTGRLQAGEIDALLIIGGNPSANAPADIPFAAALEAFGNAAHLTDYENETSRQCRWTLPRAHVLETWADTRAYDGTLSIVQPLIAPLLGGKTASEVIAALLGDPAATAYALSRTTFFGGGAAPTENQETAWRQALHAGVVENTAFPTQRVSADGGVPTLPDAPAEDGLELQVVADYSVYDGRFANNGWLQEMPDPLTKLTWDNAVLVSPTDAQEMRVERGDMVELRVGERVVQGPVFVQPGQAVGVVTVALGYGLELGRVSSGAGFDVNPLRTSDALFAATGVTVTKAGGQYLLATTQDHHYMRSQVGDRTTQERVERLIREADLNEYKSHPDFAAHVVHLPVVKPLWEPDREEYENSPHNQWAMTIDLTACTGCSACVVACQAENNIPVVGKEEIDLGREMHWMRIDRYFKGDADDIDGVAVQPMTCHHCENAPCESVCPVAATVHDEEGLNGMTYNRCIGTRYCSNNCPFKVRRFNWFYNHHGPKHPRPLDLTTLEQMMFNPDVTVRSRGVMEKCTFCVQRISEVRRRQRVAGEPIEDGMITPACAQACPADAIAFGDLRDPNSRVKQLSTHKRSYELLGELNLNSRLNYLARINNPPGGGEAHHGANGHNGHGAADTHGAAPHGDASHSDAADTPGGEPNATFVD